MAVTRPLLVVIVTMDDINTYSAETRVSVEQAMHTQITQYFPGKGQVVVCFDTASQGTTGVTESVENTGSAPVALVEQREHYYRTQFFLLSLTQYLFTTQYMGRHYNIPALRTCDTAQYIVLKPTVRLDHQAIASISSYLTQYARVVNRNTDRGDPTIPDVVYAVTPIVSSGGTAPGLLPTWLMLLSTMYIMFCNAWRLPFFPFTYILRQNVHLPSADVTLMGASPGDLRRNPNTHVGYLPGAVRQYGPRESILHTVMQRLQYQPLGTLRTTNLLAYWTISAPLWLFIYPIVRDMFGVSASTLWNRGVALVTQTPYAMPAGTMHSVSFIRIALALALYGVYMSKMQKIAYRVLTPAANAAVVNTIIVAWPLALVAYLLLHTVLWILSWFGAYRTHSAGAAGARVGQQAVKQLFS